MTTSPVIATIHASPVTILPVRSAFEEKFPSADLWHLLDDRLVTDAERAGGLTEVLHQRMATLIQYAIDAGADAIQLACSMYAPVAHAVAYPIPVLASDDSLFNEVIRLRPGSVTLLSSLEPAAKDSCERLGSALTAADLQPRIDDIVVAEAKTAAAMGDWVQLGHALIEAARIHNETDVLVLAQYSLAPARTRIADTVNIPVLSGPHLAAMTLAMMFGRDTIKPATT